MDELQFFNNYTTIYQKFIRKLLVLINRRPILEEGSVRKVRTICELCFYYCGIDVYLKDGDVIRVSGVKENPSNRGEVCMKAKALPEIHHSPGRLRHPLIHEADGWRRASWDEALDMIASKLRELKGEREERKVAIFQGVGVGHHLVKWFMMRFADLYGTPNFSSVSSISYLSRAIGHILTYGDVSAPRFEETNCMVLWGSDPYATLYPRWGSRVLEAKRRGAKLIIIDPGPNHFADRADLLLQPLPGTDLALALGFINVIITKGLHDEGFVDRWTIGFEELKERVAVYTPEFVEKMTTVPKEKIEEAARMYATLKPSSILQGAGIELQLDGVQTSRALAILHAITGNLDVKGGNMLGVRLPMLMLRFTDRVNGEPLGGSEFPFFYEIERSAHMRNMIDAMAEGKPYPVKVLILAGGNPMVTWPDTRKVRRALANLELFVVIDVFMTETAKLAHIVLPAADFLERPAIGDYGHYIAPPYVAIGKEVVPPLEEAKPDIMIFAELARKLGMSEYFPWKDLREAIRAVIGPSGIKLEEVDRQGGGIYYSEKRFKGYEDVGFKTPSGKIELYSKRLEEAGQDPIPRYGRKIALDGRYPLLLITGLKRQGYVSSQFRNIPALRSLEQEPLLYVNPQTAQRYDIKDGDLVILRTVNAEREIKVKLSRYIHPNAVGVVSGWSGINELTDWNDYDPISGFPNLRAITCNIDKKQ